jgi:adenine deaminase
MHNFQYANIASNLLSYIKMIPKAELHIHLEGSIEPETLFRIADRNKIKLKYKTINELRSAYNFADLRDFLTIYTQGTQVLRTEIDFYEITKEYLHKASVQNIKHAEIFIDFQTYEKRGLSSDIIMEGILKAKKDAFDEFSISSYFILAFLRHLGVKPAIETLKKSIKYKDHIIGIGLAAAEIGFPPSLFTELYDMARQYGFKTTAHAGEEGPASYVKESIEYLKVDRIDHGNRAMDDPELLQVLLNRQIPLTICPMSNVALKNVKKMKDHTLKKKLDMGLLVCVNSDDPAYFKGYLNENFLAVTSELNLDYNDIYNLARNSFIASFLDEGMKEYHLKNIELFNQNFNFSDI